MLLGHSQKKQCLEQALPVITGLFQSRLHPYHSRRIRMLLDSGALQSIVHKNMAADHVLIPQFHYMEYSGRNISDNSKDNHYI
jgi:hypothetical protein